MKAKRKTTSPWSSLPWEKISGNEDEIIDDSQFLDAKNHYDDPNADPSELYHEGMKIDRSRDVEGCDDPGILVGLEVIDGSQYKVEKVKVGEGYNAGFVTRLVVNDFADTIKETASSNLKSDDSSNQTKTKKSKKKSKVNDSSIDLSKKLTRKEKKGKKFKELIAKRKEKMAEKKRKRVQDQGNEETESTPDKRPRNNDNTNDTKKEKTQILKKEKQSENQEDIVTNIPKPIVANEEVDSLQNSWSTVTSGVYLHKKICEYLHEMKFNHPTPIQASTLAAAVLGHRDVVGAAPTGSGKTLSYLIPIVQYLLTSEDEHNDQNVVDQTIVKRPFRKLTAMILCPTRELTMQVSREYCKLISPNAGEPYYNRIKCGTIVGGLAEQKQKRVLDQKRPPVLICTPGRLWDLMSTGEHEHLSNLTQLRFLIIDEADRMVSQGSFPHLTHIFENIRKANPSPSDLEEDSESDDDDEDENRLKSLPGVRGESKLSMLDDDMMRMIEGQSEGRKGSIDNQREEIDITQPIEIDDEEYEREQQRIEQEIEAEETDIGSDDEESLHEIPVKRQTYIYSATLTLPSFSKETVTSSKRNKGNNKKKLSVDGAIGEILEKVGAQGQIKIVDLSTGGAKEGKNKSDKKSQVNLKASPPEVKLPPGLSLYEIQCTQRHKDSHLYSFLTTTKQGSSGPCLVFANSIGAVKRIGETLKTLGLPVRMLHAQLQQKSRMGAIESLTKANSRSIVVATDVAARGLDIPTVATVVHYDVPRTVDTFVHRAGRTARGMGENAVGWSVSLVSAPEEKNHKLICRAIRGLEVTHFDKAPMDGRLLTIAQERVNLASKIVACEDAENKTRKTNQWFIDAANEADLDVGEDLLDDGLMGGSRKDVQSVIEARQARQQLRILLSKPMRTQSFGKFLSGAGLSEAIRTEAEVKPFVVTKKARNV